MSIFQPSFPGEKQPKNVQTDHEFSENMDYTHPDMSCAGNAPLTNCYI